jgi:hypothetical protein
LIFSMDLWHKGWGFGFSLCIWERLTEDVFVKVELDWQINIFHRTFGTGDKD